MSNSHFVPTYLIKFIEQHEDRLGNTIEKLQLDHTRYVSFNIRCSENKGTVAEIELLDSNKVFFLYVGSRVGLLVIRENYFTVIRGNVSYINHSQPSPECSPRCMIKVQSTDDLIWHHASKLETAGFLSK